jgi:hypothetical protein
MTHELKCWPEFFQAILSGSKTFEARRDDRNFKVGDNLVLKEWTPADSIHSNEWEYWLEKSSNHKMSSEWNRHFDNCRMWAGGSADVQPLPKIEKKIVNEIEQLTADLRLQESLHASAKMRHDHQSAKQAAEEMARIHALFILQRQQDSEENIPANVGAEPPRKEKYE